MPEYTVSDLEKWEKKIKNLIDSFGLDPYPQIFEFCDQNQMIGYMSYSGMPARYPHWSFGKQYEKQKTLYDLGVAGLPYEMVINSNPCLAYLMSDNSLLLQILTIAHVYAHNDFFRNNFSFRNTYAEYTLEKFKAHADRIRKYHEDPRIGFRKVEVLLDTAHALSLNCRRYSSVKKGSDDVTDDEDDEEFEKKTKQENDQTLALLDEVKDAKEDEKEEKSRRIPSEPDEDILLFIRDHNLNLSEWEKDILTIVHEEAQYFIPQIETKTMNEGWASYWHKKILDNLDLPQDMQMEFMVRHNQVLRPIPRSLNPYHLGFKIIEDIVQRWDEPSDEDRETFDRKGSEGMDKIFQVRETDRDESFIRQYLTKELMDELDLYQHEDIGGDRVVTKVASDDHWEELKETIIANTGLNSMPVIKIHDADFDGYGKLLLVHEFDERELDRDYARHTLQYIRNIWQKTVILETRANNRKVQMICEADDKFEIREF